MKAVIFLAYYIVSVSIKTFQMLVSWKGLLCDICFRTYRVIHKTRCRQIDILFSSYSSNKRVATAMEHNKINVEVLKISAAHFFVFHREGQQIKQKSVIK